MLRHVEPRTTRGHDDDDDDDTITVGNPTGSINLLHQSLHTLLFYLSKHPSHTHLLCSVHSLAPLKYSWNLYSISLVPKSINKSKDVDVKFTRCEPETDPLPMDHRHT